MLEPDTKDWTWVLSRRCPECGFDASTCRADEVAPLVLENSRAWESLLTSGAIRPGRPNDSTWSPLEYACHVRDVFTRYRTRITLMLNEHDPLFENWDQDASAVSEGYEDQDPATVIGELRSSAVSLAELLAARTGPDWERPGRRSDGASFTLDTISRYMVHDPIHHLFDVTGGERPAGPG